MGGTGFSIRVRARGSAKPEQEAVKAVCDAAIELINEQATRPEDGQVTTDYVMSVAEDSTLAGKDLHFTFMDGAGLCSMSHLACMHWFQLALP